MAVIGKNGGADGGVEWSGEQRRAVAAVTATVILLPHPQTQTPLSCNLTSAPGSPLSLLQVQVVQVVLAAGL